VILLVQDKRRLHQFATFASCCVIDAPTNLSLNQFHPENNPDQVCLLANCAVSSRVLCKRVSRDHYSIMTPYKRHGFIPRESRAHLDMLRDIVVRIAIVRKIFDREISLKFPKNFQISARGDYRDDLIRRDPKEARGIHDPAFRAV